MPIGGAALKPESERLNRTKPVHDFVDIPDLPYLGPVPVELPGTREATAPFGDTYTIHTHDLTKQWWSVLTRMPHCVLWGEAEWQYALATALVADEFFHGRMAAATELARREKVLGATWDARRSLRIRYVPVKENEAPAEVTRIADYRDL